MDFARNMMKKCGWKDGDGLGRHRNGIVQPLQANLKYDSHGFGHDRATEFNDHWWERVYNDASSNLTVDSASDGIKMSLKSPDSVEISTKSYSVAKLKKANKMTYGSFLKAATLKQNAEESCGEAVSMDVYDNPIGQVLTDEELLKACGGRTAHKGARHGVVCSGKLARIAQQEHDFLKRLSEKRSAGKPSEIFEPDLTQKSKKKQKKATRRKDRDANGDADEITTPATTEQYQSGVLSHKQQRKAQRVSKSELRCQNLEITSQPIKKTKAKKNLSQKALCAMETALLDHILSDSPPVSVDNQNSDLISIRDPSFRFELDNEEFIGEKPNVHKSKQKKTATKTPFELAHLERLGASAGHDSTSRRANKKKRKHESREVQNIADIMDGRCSITE